MLSSRWNIHTLTPEDQALCRSLSRELNISPVSAQLLVDRNIRTADEARAFIRPSLASLHDPLLMRDMDKAVARVFEALGGEMEEEFECFRAYCTLRVAMRLDLDSFGDSAVGLAYVRRARDFAKAVSKSPLASRIWRLRCALFAFSPAAHNAMYALYGRVSGKVIG